MLQGSAVTTCGELSPQRLPRRRGALPLLLLGCARRQPPADQAGAVQPDRLRLVAAAKHAQQQLGVPHALLQADGPQPALPRRLHRHRPRQGERCSDLAGVAAAAHSGPRRPWQAGRRTFHLPCPSTGGPGRRPCLVCAACLSRGRRWTSCARRPSSCSPRTPASTSSTAATTSSSAARTASRARPSRTTAAWTTCSARRTACGTSSTSPATRPPPLPLTWCACPPTPSWTLTSPRRPTATA